MSDAIDWAALDAGYVARLRGIVLPEVTGTVSRVVLISPVDWVDLDPDGEMP